MSDELEQYELNNIKLHEKPGGKLLLQCDFMGFLISEDELVDIITLLTAYREEKIDG